MNKKEIIHAVNVLIAHAENAKCDELHHPTKWLHKDDELCPALYELHKQANIVSKFMKDKEVIK